MTKSEMVKALVTKGYDENELKKFNAAGLENMLAEFAAADTTPLDENATKAAETNETEAAETKIETTIEYETILEHTQQLKIFSDYIYHVKHKGAKVTVLNAGMGDVYISTEGLAEVSKKCGRLSFNETASFENVDILYFISASQPTITIIEEK